MKNSVKGGIIATVLFAAAGGAYYLGTMNPGVEVNQPIDLPSTEVVEQIVDFRPTPEDPTPTVVETEGDFESRLALLTTPEGRSARRAQLFEGINAIIEREVEVAGGWYTLLADPETQENRQILIAQITRYVNAHIATDLAIAQEYTSSINMRLDEIIPEDMSTLSYSDREVLLSSLSTIRSEYSKFYWSGTGHTFRTIRDEFPNLRRPNHFLPFLDHTTLMEEVRLDWLNDYLSRFELTDDEQIQVRGADSADSLHEVAVLVTQSRLDSYPAFDFRPYQIRFLETHDLPEDLFGRERNDENDFISWMLWVYRQPMKERALEGLDQNSSEYDSVIAQYSVFQPENGWGGRVAALREAEGDLLTEVSQAWDAYVSERDENMEMLRSYGNQINAWTHKHRDVLRGPVSNLLIFAYRDIHNPERHEGARPLMDTMNRINTAYAEVRR
jgi:hypothetical protein